MEWAWVVAAVVAVAVVGVMLLWRPLRSFGREVQAERARELFALQRQRLEEEFLGAAAASGKPRGLRWQQCDFNGELVLARDRQTRLLVALVPVTIRFDAVPGSDMEDLPALANLRTASAVFFFQRGRWHTAGKAVFNMNPDEALRHFEKQYQRVAEGEKG